jgi:hypothetical protein
VDQWTLGHNQRRIGLDQQSKRRYLDAKTAIIKKLHEVQENRPDMWEEFMADVRQPQHIKSPIYFSVLELNDVNLEFG